MALQVQHRKHMIAPRISDISRENLKAACVEFQMSLNEIVDRLLSKPARIAEIILDTVTAPAFVVADSRGGNPAFREVKEAKAAGKRLTPRQRKTLEKMQRTAAKMRRAKAQRRKGGK